MQLFLVAFYCIENHGDVARSDSRSMAENWPVALELLEIRRKYKQIGNTKEAWRWIIIMWKNKQILHDSTYYGKTQRLSILVASFLTILNYLCNLPDFVKDYIWKKIAKRRSQSKKSWDTSFVDFELKYSANTQFCISWTFTKLQLRKQPYFFIFPRRLPILIKKNKTDIKGRTNLKSEGWSEFLRDVLLSSKWGRLI